MMNKVPYYDELVEIRTFLTDYFTHKYPERDAFPRNKCRHTSKFISYQLDIDVVAGYYGNSWHAWNYDKHNDVYIDITLAQFDDVHKPISLLKPDTTIIRKCDKQTRNHYNGKGIYGISELTDMLESYNKWKLGLPYY